MASDVENLREELRIVKRCGRLAVMAIRPVELGPTGERVADNVAAVRESARLQQRELAERMSERGRPMQASVISKIEKRDRRVDVDDLVTLALALDVTPNRLLLDHQADEHTVMLTPSCSCTSRASWNWATGRAPLDTTGADMEHIRKFRALNRPTERPGSARELLRDPKAVEDVKPVLLAVSAAVRAGHNPEDIIDFIRLVAAVLETTSGTPDNALRLPSENPQG